MQEDVTDRIVAEWGQERPDLDTSALKVVSRINMLARIMKGKIDGVLTNIGLPYEVTEILFTLRRSGPPYRRTPTQISQGLLFSSATITNRLDRLEKAGYIIRLPDPSDRRGTLIELTPEGAQVVDEVIQAHLANMSKLIDGLSPEEHKMLEGLLRKLLLSMDFER